MAGFRSETEGGVRSAFGGIGKIVAGAFAGVAAFDFVKSAVEGAASLQKSQETIQVAFGKSSEAVVHFNETAAKLGISAATGEAAAAKVGILFKNMGVCTEQAAKMTVGWGQLTGALASVRGIDPAAGLDKMNLGAAGNLR